MSERSRLAAELAHLHALLDEIPRDSVFERASLESRATEVATELAERRDAQVAAQRLAKVALTFGGRPVFGTWGIDARFGTEALRTYQDLVSKVMATNIKGPLASAGPVPYEEMSHLHITGVQRGSFGFELEEAPLALELGFSPLHMAVEHANQIVRAACDSDDALADALDEVGERVHGALRNFLLVVGRAGASFRINSETVEESFDTERVRSALERAELEFRENVDIPIPGVFRGVLLDSRRFDHRDEQGRQITGRIVPEREPSDFLPWVNRRCVAHMRVTTLVRSGRAPLTRFVLKSIEAAPGSDQPG